jgi:hypothetical protein
MPRIDADCAAPLPRGSAALDVNLTAADRSRHDWPIYPRHFTTYAYRNRRRCGLVPISVLAEPNSLRTCGKESGSWKRRSRGRLRHLRSSISIWRTHTGMRSLDRAIATYQEACSQAPADWRPYDGLGITLADVQKSLTEAGHFGDDNRKQRRLPRCCPTSTGIGAHFIGICRSAHRQHAAPDDSLIHAGCARR